MLKIMKMSYDYLETMQKSLQFSIDDGLPVSSTWLECRGVKFDLNLPILNPLPSWNDSKISNVKQHRSKSISNRAMNSELASTIVH